MIRHQFQRRQFLGAALAAAVGTRVHAQPANLWGGPVLDFHFHIRQTPEANLEHLDGCGVSHAVLLTAAGALDRTKTAMAKAPDRFVFFASANVGQPAGIEQLRKAAKDGAKGFGEIKLHLPFDSSEMRELYELAAELNVPVTIHFQEVQHFEGEGSFAMGFDKLPAVLKAYPKTKFIGHADNFWAHISSDVPSNIAYPTGKVKPGGLSDRMLADYANLYGDLSANSGRNALGRDPDFAAAFLARHQNKLLFGSDCSCKDGQGAGQGSQEPLIKGKCVARETLTALKQLTSPAVFRKITWENGTKLLNVWA